MRLHDEIHPDELTHQLYAMGKKAEAGFKIMAARYLAGDVAGAAAACFHGWGYPLNSLAATNVRDPLAGGDGYRCIDCGSVLDRDPFITRTVRVLLPCQQRPHASHLPPEA